MSIYVWLHASDRVERVKHDEEYVAECASKMPSVIFFFD